MSITVRQEQQFYDAAYAGFLRVPDDALRINRETITKDVTGPAGAFYERRKLYSAVFRQILSEPLEGRCVLDYGCGLGEWGVLMATEGARATLLDLSPIAIEIALRRAAASGVNDRVRGFAKDASHLDSFKDEEFDLIYASAALHHTLKYPNAVAELVRVLRPGGKLILAETYGNNVLLNWLRRGRCRLTGQPEEAGEEIILSDQELDLLRGHFRRVDVTPMNLFAMAKRLFRGRFHSPVVRRAMAVLESVDDLVFRVLPPAKRYCGEVFVVATK